MTRFIALFLLGVAGMPLAIAHKPSDAYLTIERTDDAIRGRLDIALRDLELAIGLDANGDGEITWGEVRRSHDAIAALAIRNVSVTASHRPCPLTVTGHRIDRHTDGAYAVVDLAGRCEARGTLAIDYKLLFDVDPQHRGLANVVDDGASRALVLSVDRPRAVVTGSGRVEQFTAYVREGALHIVTGFDHLLFLVGLLLPAVLVRIGREWQPVASARAVALDVLTVVTAFTVAHAITLTLATLKWIAVPSRVAESIVALSIVAAALNNVRPVVRARWGVAFAFGLVHGLGFAHVLAGLNLTRDVLLLALVAFNLGVELGQLAVAIVWLPLAYMMRGTRVYRGFVLIGGSLVIAFLGLGWFVERAFGVSMLPG
ncbi:MAG TPA: HupE/UreJ family protein [Casimicrobiaceae bacterium]|nr:HupE/UreJ family protein [Casimicrobiaceae bacterium]